MVLEAEEGMVAEFDLAVEKVEPWADADPAGGSWRAGHLLSRDPLGEAAELNLYAYVRNEPLGLVDPFGLKDRRYPFNGRINNWSRRTVVGVDIDNQRVIYVSPYGYPGDRTGRDVDVDFVFAGCKWWKIGSRNYDYQEQRDGVDATFFKEADSEEIAEINKVVEMECGPKPGRPTGEHCR